MRKRSLLCILCLFLCAALCLPALADVTITFLDEDGEASVNQNQTNLPETEEASPVSGGAREDFINDIIALGQKEYEHTNGRAQEAQYSSSIFICKNFTVYLFP